MNTIKDHAADCLRAEAKALLALIPLLTDDLDHAINLISHCKGKIIVTGIGKSGHIGAKIAATLASIGSPAFFVNPVDGVHGDLGMISEDDIVLAVSNSGQTEELLRFIVCIRKRSIPVIAMTGNPQSVLAQEATYHIHIAVDSEACPLNLAPTSSTTAMLAMGDAIACTLIRVKNVRKEDFYLFHPGGSLGKRLEWSQV